MIRGVCIEEHGSDLVEQGSVHALCNTVMLGGVRSCDFVFDSLLLEVQLDAACSVLTPSIGAKGLGRHAHFHFGC
jgi:hypothetical protein